jgi:hypothetical protein
MYASHRRFRLKSQEQLRECFTFLARQPSDAQLKRHHPQARRGIFRVQVGDFSAFWRRGRLHAPPPLLYITVGSRMYGGRQPSDAQLKRHHPQLLLSFSLSVYSRCCIRIYSAMVGVPHRPLNGLALPPSPSRVIPRAFLEPFRCFWRRLLNCYGENY